MLDIVIKFIASVITLVGVILVYDARIITQRVFGFGDQNEATKGLKILGGLVGIIGILIIFFTK